MSFEFSHTESDNKGAFVAKRDGHVAGKMTYSRMSPVAVIIDHTEVRPGFEGHALGKQLVTRGVTWARETGQRILPLCPFAKALFERTPEFADVWYR